MSRWSSRSRRVARGSRTRVAARRHVPDRDCARSGRRHPDDEIDVTVAFRDDHDLRRHGHRRDRRERAGAGRPAGDLRAARRGRVGRRRLRRSDRSAVRARPEPGRRSATPRRPATRVPGTSCNTADYVTTSGSLNFAPGETTKVVRVQLLDCPDVEGLVSFRFTLSAPVERDDREGEHARQHRQQRRRRSNAAALRARRGRRREGRLGARAGAAGRPGRSGPGLRQHRHRRLRDARRHGASRRGDYADDVTARSASRPARRRRPSSCRSSTPARSRRGASRSTLINPSSNADDRRRHRHDRDRLELGRRRSRRRRSRRRRTSSWARATATSICPCASRRRDSTRYPSATTTSGGTASGRRAATAPRTMSASPTGASLTFASRRDDEGRARSAARLHRRRGAHLVQVHAQRPPRTRRSRGRARSSASSTTRPWSRTPRLVVRDAVVDQKDGSVLVPVLLGGPAGQASTTPVTVQYATSDGTATAGVDYSEASRHAQLRARPDGQEHRRADRRRRAPSRRGASPSASSNVDERDPRRR